MATAVTKYIAADGTQWDDESLAMKRDQLDAEVRAIEATLPKPPNNPDDRLAVDPDVFKAAKTAVVELCRREYPREAIFQHDPMEIHPFSFAGRLLDDVGGPLRRVWWRFMCYRDGWMHEQPYWAQNPGKFTGR
jgi:hypothetical protein